MPNFVPETNPGAPRSWPQTIQGLGFDLLMVSDHIVVIPDVAEQYPAPFYEPFTTLAWLALARTSRVRPEPRRHCAVHGTGRSLLGWPPTLTSSATDG